MLDNLARIGVTFTRVPSLDDLKAAVATARNEIDAARVAREAATFDLDAAELALLQGELRDADPINSAVQEAAQVSELDGHYGNREALCDAVDAFFRSLRAGGYVSARGNVVKVRPPLTFGPAEAELFLDRFDSVLRRLAE